MKHLITKQEKEWIDKSLGCYKLLKGLALGKSSFTRLIKDQNFYYKKITIKITISSLSRLRKYFLRKNKMS